MVLWCCSSRVKILTDVPSRCTSGDFVLMRVARQGSGGELIERPKGQGEVGSDGVGVLGNDGMAVMSRVERTRRVGEWTCLGGRGSQ